MEQIHQIVDNERRLQEYMDEHTKLTNGFWVYHPYIPLFVTTLKELLEDQEKEKAEKK